MVEKRRRGDPEERREALLEAAEALFAARPYEDVSMDDVADAVGVAHGLPFHYFGNKLGLYLAMLERWNAQRMSRFQQNNEHEPSRWLREELSIIMDDAQASPETYGSIVRNTAGAEVGEVRAKLRHRATERLIEKLDPTEATPLLELAVGAWMTFESQLIATWAAQLDTPRDELTAILVDVFGGALSAVAQSEESPSFSPTTFA